MKQSEIPTWPSNGGAMGACLRSRDWSQHAFGPMPAWPQHLKTAADILLRLPLPAILLWGDAGLQLYNDACLPLFGAAHPHALGRAFADCWPALWRQEPALQDALRSGTACMLQDRLLPCAGAERRFNLGCTPVPGPDSRPAGLLLTLHEAAEHLHLLEDVFRHTPSFLHVLSGPDFITEFANEAYYQLVGRRDLLGKPLFEALPDMMSARYQGLLSQVRNTGQPFVGRELLLTLVREPGRPPEERYIDLVYSPLGDAGNDDRLLGYGVDVTDHARERLTAEARLRESEARMSAIFSRAAVGLSEISLQGGFLRVNDTLCEMLGRSRADLLACGVPDVTHPDDIGPSLAGVSQLIGTGEKVSLDKRYVRPDGSLIYANSVLTLLHDGRGAPRSLLAVTVDLTERKLAAEALRESEEHYRYTVELNPQVNWTAGPDGSIDGAPQRWIEWTGIAPGNDGWRRALHPEDLPRVSAAWRKSVRTGKPLDIEYRLRMREGHYRWVRGRAFPRRDEQGSIIRWYGTMENIHDRKLAEEALRRSEELHRYAAEAGHIGSFDLDLGSMCMVLSAQMAMLLGYEAEHMQLPAAQWKRLVLEEDLPMLLAALEQAAASDRRMEVEYRVVHRRGNIRWMYSRGGAVRDDSGRAVRVHGVSLDITERKQSEEALRASEERYRSLTELSPDAILVNVDNTIVYANLAAARMLGAESAETIVGHSPFEFIEPPYHPMAGRRISEARESGDSLPLMEQRWRRLDGSGVAVQVSAGSTLWEGRPAIQVLLRDITEHKRTQDELRISNERLKLAVEGSGEGIWDWDIPHDRYNFSPRLKSILGWNSLETRDNKLALRRRMHPEDLPRAWAALRAYIEGKEPAYSCDFRVRCNDGSWRWLQSRGIIVARDENGRPLLMTGTMADISQKKEADEQIWRHANFDALTGLPNRRLFRDRLDQEVLKAARSRHRIALLFIDLDRFKQVNDLLGHDAGDLLLMQAAARLKSCVRESDTVARLGGDEFTVILTELDGPGHVEQVCQKILETLEQPFNIGKEVAYMSGSVGVTVYPEDAIRSEELIRKADQAMYAAKNAGKNQFSYFTQAMDEKAHQRLRLATELRSALATGQLEVHYQPVVDLLSGRIVKAEALLRWHHPRLGLVEPANFIPLAEETGIINQIGNWVFKEAASCSKAWSLRIGAPFQIGVNKSPIQFLSSNKESDWRRHLEGLGLPGSSISIEITEGMLLHASSSVTNRLLEYRDAGIQVAIDDFGTGYSSMAYLKKFDIDYLKIDQSFVHDMEHDIGSRTIAESIIVMAHKLGLKVIAEGIESEEQRRLLVEAGCDFGQGYLFSEALPPREFERLLSGEVPARHVAT